STVSKRLKGLGMIQKQGHWVPYELKPRTTASTAEKKRFFASHRIVTGDEKWIHYDNPKRRKSWGKPGHASRKTAAIRAKTEWPIRFNPNSASQKSRGPSNHLFAIPVWHSGSLAIRQQFSD
ncbi:MOS1T transposase, partial [Pseudoatta argentina]